MKKYYFQHDLTARYDEKISYLCRKYGGVAYGMYWAIVEQLHKEETNKLDFNKRKLDDIATFLKIDVDELIEMIKFSINECELFESDGSYFWSNRVLKNIDKMNEIKNARSGAGKASAEAKRILKEQQNLTNCQQNSTNVEQILTSVEQNSTNSILFNLDLTNNTNSTNNSNGEISKKIALPFKFSDIPNELKVNSKTKMFCIQTYKIKESDYEKYIDWFIGLQNDETDNVIVDFKEWNKHFKEWMKFNYGKLPEAKIQSQSPKKNIITPPKDFNNDRL